MRFSINQALDPRELHSAYLVHRRLHIPQFLAPESADLLFRHLVREIDWHLTFRGEDKSHEITPEKLDTAPSEPQIAVYAYKNAQKGQFQYLYEHHRVADNPGERAKDSSLLARFTDFLNAAESLEFMRRVTGCGDIAKANALATRYRPGHFLTRHDDWGEGGGKRRVAYVYNLTPEWQPDCGGQLQFIDKNGHIAEAYVPRFNALNIFSVPQFHAVSMVTPFTRGPRLSVTGWFQAS